MPIKSVDADLIRLQHMWDACQEVALFIRRKTRSDLEKDRMLALSIIKEIEMIGEAASKMTDAFKKTHSEIPWDLIIAARNRLIHGYFDIDLDIVWETTTKDLPELAKMMGKLLNKK